MEKEKTIHISGKTHKILTDIKYNQNFKDYDAVINHLLHLKEQTMKGGKKKNE